MSSYSVLSITRVEDEEKVELNAPSHATTSIDEFGSSDASCS